MDVVLIVDLLVALVVQVVAKIAVKETARVTVTAVRDRALMSLLMGATSVVTLLMSVWVVVMLSVHQVVPLLA